MAKNTSKKYPKTMSKQEKEVMAPGIHLKNKWEELKKSLGKRDGGMATKRKSPSGRGGAPSEERQWSPTDPKKLKEPGPKQKGIKRLPPEVRNKMGYMKEGGMVLEIGLRPATKSEMKMAKEMKKPIKKAGGGMVRGTGAAITGKGFKGVF